MKHIHLLSAIIAEEILEKETPDILRVSKGILYWLNDTRPELIPYESKENVFLDS